MARDYHFADATLRSVPLRALNWLGAGLARLGAEPPSLAPAAIVAAAQRRAGTPELGGDSFREPLERYVASVESEAQLNTFGRIAVRQMLVGSLANRFALADWAREHPEVRDERIEAPWVIVGLPRTGTSLLSILLGLDPLVRPLLHWEAAHPVPPPDLATAGEDPRIALTAKEIDGLHRLNPALRAMHPFGATVAQECVALFMYDVRTLGVETQAYVPSYGKWLQACDMSPAYEQHRLALQALQSAQPTERWVLKTPNHLWCLPTLLRAYPDARIVWTHRDPGPVVTSLASLTNALQRMFTQRRDPAIVGAEWNAKARHAIESGLEFDRDRERAGEPGWCCHVQYRDLISDPVASVRRIQAHFGEDTGSLHERRMQRWMSTRHQSAFGRHVYAPRDFGWTYEGLAAEYREYRERFDVPREDKG